MKMDKKKERELDLAESLLAWLTMMAVVVSVGFTYAFLLLLQWWQNSLWSILDSALLGQILLG